MEQKPRLLILTNRPLHNGPRMVREFEALKQDFVITAIGITKPLDEDVRYIPQSDFIPSLPERVLHKIYRKLSKGKYWHGTFPSLQKRMTGYIENIKPNVIITHEAEFFPYLVPLKKRYNFKLVYNAHEYHPRQYDSNKEWLNTKGAHYQYLYKKFINDVDLVINVCDGIAQECLKDFGKSSIVIPNACSYYPNIAIKENNSSSIKMIHHGAAIRDRKVEYMMEATEQLGKNYFLDVVLVPGDAKYIEELKSRYEGDQIRFLEPVAYKEIVPMLNQYDIGLFNLPPHNFNYLNALPNKLFEFIQARLCIVISNSPEMKKIVEKYNLGRISKGYSVQELVETLQPITKQDILFYKNNADKAAKNVGAEKYYETYQKELNNILQ